MKRCPTWAVILPEMSRDRTHVVRNGRLRKRNRTRDCHRQLEAAKNTDDDRYVTKVVGVILVVHASFAALLAMTLPSWIERAPDYGIEWLKDKETRLF